MSKIIYITLLVFGLIFVAPNILLKNFGTSAKISKSEMERRRHYEKNFQELTLKTLKGKKIELKKAKSPIIIVNFWASWCGPCKDEFKYFNKLEKIFSKDEILVIGINTQEKSEMKDIKKAIKDYKLNFPIVTDFDGSIAEKYLITAIPVSIIYHKGKVIEGGVSDGPMDFASEENVKKFKKYLKN